MSEFTVALRFVHFAAAVALFGELAFLVWTARPDPGATLRRRTMRVAAWCLALALASALLWLAVQAAEMSGLPLARALNRGTLGVVLSETLFGRVWVVRFVLATALGAALFLARREPDGRGAALDWACAALAGALLATLAWTGHAAAEQGTDRIVHLSADALHLLAAGAWLGALLPLAHLLGRARRAANAPALEFAAQVARRFSAVGMASVGALVLTGVANTWYTLGSVPALFGTDYGRLLLAKLALFATMIALAATNRLRWTPRLRATGESAQLALRRLRRNAIAETLLALAVLGIVGALGITVPALHVQTVWPFPYTISAWRLVPAHPSTYFRSPVRYTAASIARGAPLYGEYCAACHGSHGHGDGPAAASLAVRTPNLTEHVFHHREGDMLWWLQHGIPGTPMPGFGDRISDERLWDLLNFLRAQADSENAKEMESGVGRPIAAPDFDFQIAERPQESLRAHRGRYVLLVFCTAAAADGRLRALKAAEGQLRRAGVRVVAMPVNGAPLPANARMADDSMIADPDPQVAAAYALFRGTASRAPGGADDLEFLIDREGYLRARWTPGEKPDWSRISELLGQIEILNREAPHGPARDEHVH
jgi:copper resistance protein D